MKEEKERIRAYIWKLLEERGVARFPKPISGRIPNFVGAEEAAEKLSEQEEWKEASVIFVSPDSPQRHVRYLGLVQGKLVIMATPRLRERFLLLDPKGIPITRYSEASTISGAFKYGKKILEVPKIDLKVTGSVAVDREGGRVGKGHGYSDLEYGILGEIGAIDGRTPVATTVHDLQIVERVPMEPQDMPVYLIVTPSRVIRTGKFGNPRILWELITQDIEREIPLIRYLRGEFLKGSDA
ncbi:5-formyltetrahydrofolate cyclo-ligase [Candidatus Korarchaeum cryptofilum]|jgi:5-formyltetrahydrofolate cyclo-ligase|uniref:5-formyltetrahydrofolate cyclo-ligase n=1 Tax=Korarchaeum cryptofilum (strain OPF8) TaxID=374847 RepID=B1L771_KORCO|nr:5-formyltetrahydrofolate cyclo-ligase [Candidatus Korarchaeum cryptofilum]ACB08300.1 5-formyltetrahydrofolate cyclo-ligase [Candidatus Korarchaeum cryptofilum OPF8]